MKKGDFYAGIVDVSINKVLHQILDLHREKVALRIEEKEFTYRDLGEYSLRISSFLIKSGLKKNDKVCILSQSQPEWAFVFFGTILAGCVLCPLDTKLTFDELSFIINHAEPQILFSSLNFLDRSLDIKKKFRFIKHIVLLGDSPYSKEFTTLAEIRHIDVMRFRRIKEKDPCLLIYTSGTTGSPKGVVLTLGNLLSQAISTYMVFRFGPEDRFLSLLPLSHTYEITGGLIAPLYGGAQITYSLSPNPKVLRELLLNVKPTVMVVVPSILKMFMRMIIKEVERKSKLKKLAFYHLLRLNRLLRKMYIDLSPLFFKKVHTLLGNIKYFISGGAPLDKNIGLFFDSLGIPVCEGYGLTETAPVISVNSPRRPRYGSVGKPLEGIEVKILKRDSEDREGEVVVRGPGIMRGYYKNKELTAKVMEDGWFHTQDLGYIDKDGYLYITGRLKNLIVLPSGKKVHPEELEEKLTNSPLIKEVCIFLRGLPGKEKIQAFIHPDIEYIKMRNISHDLLRDLIEREIRELNKNLADYKKIRDFKIVYQEFPKTSTQKIKRQVAEKLFV